MPNDTPEKLDLRSMDITDEKKQQLKQLFPEVFREDKVDFDHLKRVLGEWVDPGKERFGLQWPGKAECMKTIQQPSIATLRPDREESVNFDETEHLFIEGDNLEVLKLLQKSYFGKVKMIYIDPPYNTGNEFIYPDNYTESLDTYLKYTGQKDAEGNWQSTNKDTEGRFHSKWLNMMYPRLFLAKNLLKDEGAIFVSIADHEFDNLKSILQDIFGEENFIGTIVWKNATDNNPTQIAIEHEYVLVFAKNKSSIESAWKNKVSDVKQVLIEKGDELISKHTDLDKLQEEYSKWFKRNRSQLWPLDRYKYIDFDGIYIGSQSVHNPGKEGYRYDVIHPITKKPCKQPLMGYRFPESTMENLLKEDKIIFGEDETKIIELKVYAKEYQEKLSSVIELDSRSGSYDLKNVFPDSKRLFNNPKPVKFLSSFIPFVLSNDDIILDYFAGSCSTAHTVLDLNKTDGGNRKFICVQLPEIVDAKSEARKAGFESIADIGKERIRRVIKQIEENQKKDKQLELGEEGEKKNEQDLGFKVFKLTPSNFKVWEAPGVDIEPEKLKEQLDAFSDHLNPENEKESILFELIIKSGFPLTANIEKIELEGKNVFIVEDGKLMICLAEDLSFEVLDAISEKEPQRVICLDNGFIGDDADALKTNAVQLFKSKEIEFRTV
ncbi:site-specific DNA-methyltransferase [Gracilimonas sp.]|uniref:site-specific DNA-methyltransferase n=1 Tax=Gracilimonas sp. TaxID=1974203 RepID=UPI003D0FF4A0